VCISYFSNAFKKRVDFEPLLLNEMSSSREYYKKAEVEM
jgi:hypothetical protein